jgi:peptidyl-prolyl cis-trans isomerase SurA
VTVARSRPTVRLLAAVLACCLAGAVGVALPPPASAQTGAQRIAAVVNDDVVTSQELLDRLALAVATSGLPDDQATRQRLAPQVLRGFIDEKLQLQEAERLGLEVTEAEIDTALDTIAGRNNTDRATLSRFLESRGINLRTLREQLRAQIAWIKVVGQEVRPRVVVPQEQVEFALRRAEAAPAAGEVLLSEILLPVYDRGQEAAVAGQAADLVRALRGGADFAALARQVSAGASAENGGDLGWVSTAALAPELRERIAALPAGAVSDPVVRPDGVQIFRVRERREAPAGAGADRERVRRSIEQEQLERQAARYLRDLRREAFVDVRL